MTTTEPADRGDIQRELGDLDEGTVERILALGPTIAHLVAARAQLRNADHHDELERSEGPVVDRLVDLLRWARDRELDRTEREEVP